MLKPRPLPLSALIGSFVAALAGCGGAGAGPAAAAGASGAASGGAGSTTSGGAGGTTSGGAGNSGAAGNLGAGGTVPTTPLPSGGMAACAAFVKATCAKRDSCSGGKGTTVLYGGAATCEARELPKCLATLMARGTSKTVATLTACTNSLPQQTCTDYFDNILTTACQPMAGSLANGAACLSSWQCASAFCSLPHADVCGTCAARPKAGDSCAQTICGTGLLCHSSTMTCAAVVGSGAACSKTAPCQAGFACVGNSATTMGTCKPEGTMTGVACDPKSLTLPGCNKDVGLYCDATALACKTFATAADGQPCGLVGGGQTVCTGGGLCVGATATAAGTCKAPVQDSAACNATTGPPCIAPAKCVGGACRSPDAVACQ
jgi:hypothetical protein